MNRRDLIEWVGLFSITKLLPQLATPEIKERTDLLIGISCTDKKIADLARNDAAYRAEQDEAFLQCMKDMWKEANGEKPYVLAMEDHGLLTKEPEGWVNTSSSDVWRPAWVTTFVMRVTV